MSTWFTTMEQNCFLFLLISFQRIPFSMIPINTISNFPIYPLIFKWLVGWYLSWVAVNHVESYSSIFTSPCIFSWSWPWASPWPFPWVWILSGWRTGWLWPDADPISGCWNGCQLPMVHSFYCYRSTSLKSIYWTQVILKILLDVLMRQAQWHLNQDGL